MPDSLGKLILLRNKDCFFYFWDKNINYIYYIRTRFIKENQLISLKIVTYSREKNKLHFIVIARFIEYISNIYQRIFIRKINWYYHVKIVIYFRDKNKLYHIIIVRFIGRVQIPNSLGKSTKNCDLLPR